MNMVNMKQGLNDVFVEMKSDFKLKRLPKRKKPLAIIELAMYVIMKPTTAYYFVFLSRETEGKAL